jgi:hypothetical protein
VKARWRRGADRVVAAIRLPAAAAMRYETTVLVAALNEWL